MELCDSREQGDAVSGCIPPFAEAAMDDSEREGLLQYIRQLEHTARRWRTIATVALVVLALFMLAGVIGVGTASFFVAKRARQAEMIAREQEMMARQAAEAALLAERLAAEQHKQADTVKKSKD
jgi:NaMN:DMB phosphoribosyltransferase